MINHKLRPIPRLASMLAPVVNTRQVSLRHGIDRDTSNPGSSTKPSAPRSPFSQPFSIPTKPMSDVHVELTNDQNMFVCKHPESMHPYEHTRPLHAEKAKQPDTVLKALLDKNDEWKDYTDVELMQMTYTAQEVWRPNINLKYKLRNKGRKDPQAREGL